MVSIELSYKLQNVWVSINKTEVTYRMKLPKDHWVFKLETFENLPYKFYIYDIDSELIDMVQNYKIGTDLTLEDIEKQFDIMYECFNSQS